MSFNIRYGSASDGENSWPRRQQLVMDAIKTFDPDLLGCQEVLQFQADFLQSQLPEYGFHGVGRNDGKQAGEYVPIFYRTSRFEPLDQGHFWLSETPDEPGSKSWDSSLPRMVSWVALRDRNGSQTPLIYANTHFDHRGQQARVESARLIRQKMNAIEENYPVVISGDFNTTEVGLPYQVLVAGKDLGGQKLIDSFRVTFPEPTEQEATLTGWTGRRKGRRIDWILHTPQFITLNAAINHLNEDGRYPSDHYPVQAILRMRSH